MSTPKTTMTGPVHVTAPRPDPEPVASCHECLGIAVTRTNARSVGDFSKTSDANVVLLTHLREEHGVK